MGGENGLLLGALLRASTEAKQPPKPSHKQSCPPLAERETAAVDQEHVVDPWESRKYFSLEWGSGGLADGFRSALSLAQEEARIIGVCLVAEAMVLTNFDGTGVGFGFGIGCGFGVGWGFGGMPLNFLGLGAGGGCGVGLGLGWGFGTAFGSQYRSSRVMFQGVEFTNQSQTDSKESTNSSRISKKVHGGQ
ncbi:hypothetical protein RHGRI_016317 [Rhododendron griersonianum]|uniref:Uncharacterized protein n=1 Tax=Rhododendron griersonianum TaxID=479676 RepID=A0AAV6JTQ4_9ERIC|nr:hypothetical protein RHGRI_016317 [Rhododendron griersonianum]